jgi:hypothetical protein
MKRTLAILAGLFLLLPAALLAATNPAGLWEGTLKTPNGDLGVVFNVHRDGDKRAAEMDIPAQGASGLPLKEVKVDGATVSLILPGMGDPHYEGKLSDDGKTITGNLNAGGQAIPMDLKWKSEARAVEKAQANSGEVQVLEGVWEGALDANGTQLHLRFNFTKNADGSIAGTIDSIDQGANGLPISGISRTGDTVKLDLKMIGGGFEGTLSKDASTMTGTWSQGGGSLPLTVQRKKAEASSPK